MPFIVNLSSLISLQPISTGLDAFTQLTHRYNSSSWCCSRFLETLMNKGWVATQYTLNQKTLINPYKLGKLSTLEFLQGLDGIFKISTSTCHDDYPEVLAKLEQNKKDYLSTTLEGLSATQIQSFQLLEKAWNKIIKITEEDAAKLKALLEQHQGEDIYLISNTNELNVHKIFHEFKSMIPEAGWHEQPILNQGMLTLAPKLHLCPSYLNHTFKTAKDNQEAEVKGTPDLLEAVLAKTGKSVQVISQFPKDLERAKTLGVASDNLHPAQNYFVEHKALKQKIS